MSIGTQPCFCDSESVVWIFWLWMFAFKKK